MKSRRLIGEPLRQSAHAAVSRLRFRLGGSPGMRLAAKRILKTVAGGIGYAAIVEPRWIETTLVEVAIPDLPPALDGYRIVHLSDIHFSIASGTRFVRRIVEKANHLDADMFALTGDFIAKNPRNLDRCFAELAELRAPDGLWATRGNHDHRATLSAMRRACERAGAHLLENEHAEVSIARARAVRPGEPTAHRLLLAGVGDLWEGVCNPGAALAGADKSLPAIMLSHNPQAANLLTPNHRVDLMLSGHTHGGQVRPLNRRLPVDGSRQFVSGMVQTEHTRVYISRGVGTSSVYVRWNCRPEIALVVLRRG